MDIKVRKINIDNLNSIQNLNNKLLNSEFLKIRRVNNRIIFEKGNQTFTIEQSNDDDIWFYTSEKELIFTLKLASINYQEWQTYLVFEYLMKTIIGKHILDGENKNDYSLLPEDFINLEEKNITWHSDGDKDNILKLEYSNNKIIRISISKCKNARDFQKNSVRIRTSGSSYQDYYQEFLSFYRQLCELEQRVNKTNDKEDYQEDTKEIKRYLKKY